jgi:4-diphosphocytidyl-2-C-methyl-D-erythritol kinase
MIHLKSSAKVNLSLDILSLRSDGYHELASVVHTIGIWDQINLEVTSDGPVVFSCNRPELAGDDNLCARAVHLWNTETGSHLGANLHLEKVIPVGAGLGGGSGNAAAVLLGLNKACGNQVSAEHLNGMGAKLGADVPLFLGGGSVLMEGIGDRLTPLLPLTGWLVVVKPEVSFSTPSIYRAWDGGEFDSVQGSSQMTRAVAQQDLVDVSNHLSNDLERAAAIISELPNRLVGLIKDSNALGAQMSGSGSACFGIYANEAEAQQAATWLSLELAKDVQLANSQLFVAPFCSRGVEVAP